MSRPSRRAPLGKVPPPRRTGKVPPLRPIGKAPGGDPMAHVPHVGRAPEEHSAGKPPNPRRARLTRDLHGGTLKDLFQVFPDLPRPARPAARTPVRTGARPRRVPRRG